MNYRTATIWPRQNYSADKTEIVEINIADPISRLVVTYEPDNNPAGAGPTGHPCRCITNIELVDGSEVLYSLSGAEAQGVDFYRNNHETPSIVLYTNGMYSEQIFNLNLGRYLYDPELAVDPKKFNNLQLKVTMDIDAGGDAANDGYLTVFANIFDQKEVSPIGFLMTKRVKQYTLVNSSHEYTDLPVDYNYSQIYLRAQRYGTGPEYQIDTVKISEDMDKRIPLDNTMFQILRHNAALWKPYREWIIGPGSTSAVNFFCTPCYWPAISGSPWRAATLTTGLVFYVGDGGRFSQAQAAAGPNWQALVEGWAPHAVVPLMPPHRGVIENMYDVSKISNLRLDVAGTSSVGTSQTAEVIAEQLRRY